jgi:hypothetical protein
MSDILPVDSPIPAVTALQQADLSNRVNLAMMRKSLDIQAQTAVSLLQTLPQVQPTALATEGPLGTQVNAWA